MRSVQENAVDFRLRPDFLLSAERRASVGKGPEKGKLKGVFEGPKGEGSKRHN